MIPFYKLSGAGNDFLALVEPSAPPDGGAVRAWCRRGLSLGADGLFTLERHAEGARMVHWNPDGSRGTLCLNGSRCAALLAGELGWGPPESLRLVTDAGTLETRRLGEQSIQIELPFSLEDPRPLNLEHGGAYPGFALRVGDPHFVVPWATPESLDVEDLGSALRHHPGLAPEGANIHFVAREGPHHIRLRSFERGVERETLACGTGVVAAAWCGIAQGELLPPVHARTAGGFVLTFTGEPSPAGFRRPTLSGDARIVARGELWPGASFPPPGNPGSAPP